MTIKASGAGTVNRTVGTAAAALAKFATINGGAE